MRETEKILTLSPGGEKMTFRLRKMTALNGAALLKLLLEKLLPLAVEPESAQADPRLLARALAGLTENDLKRLMTLCLNAVDLSLPAGWTPVMSGDEVGVEALETDTPLCLTLCRHAAMYNCEGFFGEGGFLSLWTRETPPAPGPAA